MNLRLILAMGLGACLSAGGGDLKALKARETTPQASDIDSAATLKSLLAEKRVKDHDSAKAAVLEGYVLKSEKEPDGDWVLVLAPGHASKRMHRLLLEVPAAWQAKNPKLAPAALEQAKGHKVRATGWLLYDTAPDDRDPRGTLWELHPVTDLEILD